IRMRVASMPLTVTVSKAEAPEGAAQSKREVSAPKRSRSNRKPNLSTMPPHQASGASVRSKSESLVRAPWTNFTGFGSPRKHCAGFVSAVGDVLRLSGNIGGLPGVQPVFLEFAIERRTPDAQLPRHLRHAPGIVVDGK